MVLTMVYIVGTFYKSAQFKDYAEQFMDNPT